MSNEEHALPSIVVPGPEVREKIDKCAAKLSKHDKRKAEEMVAKLLASPMRNAFLFVDASHVFYPYFLSQLAEYRQHPERVPDKSKDKKADADGTKSDVTTGAAASSASATTTTRVNGLVRTEGGTGALQSDPEREELLRRTEIEARRYLQDPFPNQYSLELKGGTVDVPALLMDVLTCTAQYAAKYGEPFLRAVQQRQKHNPLLRFLHADDVRHEVFAGLVASYKRILASDPDDTETRLENLQKQEHVLHVVEEKTKYVQASLARRRAALLTDDELRAKLHWATFKVLKGFTLSDLMLDGPVPERRVLVSVPATAPKRSAATAAEGSRTAPPPPLPASAASGAASERAAAGQPPGAAPSFAPVFMSSTLVRSTATNRRGPGADHASAHSDAQTRKRTFEVVEDYTPQAVAPVRRGVDVFVDTVTGERTNAADMRGGGGGISSALPAGESRYLQPPSAPSAPRPTAETYGLASDEEVAREMKRRATES